VSLTQLSAARTEVEANTAIPNAKNIATAMTSVNRAVDFVKAWDRFLERLRKDENIDEFLSRSTRVGPQIY